MGLCYFKVTSGPFFYLMVMKAIIKIVTAQKEFSKEDLDCFRRMLNVLHDHRLSARLDIKKKQVQSYKIVQSKLKTV